MPVLTTTSVLDADALGKGGLEETDRIQDTGAWVPPWVEKAALQVLVFLGLFANDELIQLRLRDIVKAYPYNRGPSGLDREWLGQFNSWEYSELVRCCDSPDSCPTLRSHRVSTGERDIALRELPVGYQEAILDLCAGERLGKMWPRLVHGLLVNYVTLRDNPGDWPEGPSFEPVFRPRVLDPIEGALDGYHPIPRARLRTPAGWRVVLNPDQSKRQAIRSQPDPFLRFLIQTGWGIVHGRLRDALGYKRRRSIASEEEQHVRWLFRRHVRQESADVIAEEYSVAESTVDSAIKQLRNLLDLQPKSAVSCLRHRKPPGRAYSA